MITNESFQFLKDVLTIIKPSSEDKEKKKNVFNEIRKILGEKLEDYGLKPEISLQGSIAKDTWLLTEPEIDIFLIFPENTSKEELKEKIFPLIKESLSGFLPQTKYSEHPYITFTYKGFTIDIVPAIKKESEDIKTAVDRTPLHTNYIVKKVDEKQKDEIRLLKKFARTIGVYGAEISVQGFSGYLLELLVIHYNSFLETIKAAAKWRKPVIIDVEKHYSEKDYDKLKNIFKNNPLIVIDPVDPKRNVAAAVSNSKFNEFIMASRLFLKKPSKYYFIPKEIDRGFVRRIVSLMEPYYMNVLIVDIRLNKELPPDTIWGEIKRSMNNIRKILEKEKFTPIRCDCWSNEKNWGVIACLLESIIRPEITKAEGPPIKNEVHALNFLEKYIYKPGSGPWIDGDRLYSMKQLKITNAIHLLEETKKSFLISDLKDSSTNITLLSWYPEILSEEPGTWILEFIWGKPRWLIPYYMTILEK